MDKEEFFINTLQTHKITRFIGDDGAIVGDFVYAMDLFCEGVHFTRKHFSPYQIAKKSMLVNISDILAMGALPKFALLGISLPKDFSNADICALQKGFSDICKEFKIKIIGGDTIADSRLNIAITMIADAPKKPILRQNFEVGDILFCTQSLGRVVRDMRYLYRGGKIAPRSKFYAPKLHARFIRDIAPFVRGGMDISDGLFYELNRISKLCAVKFRFFKPINRAHAVSGEEYELLFSVARRDIRRLNLLAKKHRINLSKIAQITRGRVKFYCRAHH